MEGLDGDTVTFPRGTPLAQTVFKCILDAIDGTRSLMYDKRAAWSLAALAPQRGAKTNLSDIAVAVMTELPTRKQGLADQISTVCGRGVTAVRTDLRTGRRAKFKPQPSRAKTVAHGFASVAKFFPPGKGLLAELGERVWGRVGDGVGAFGHPDLSSGGRDTGVLVGA